MEGIRKNDKRQNRLKKEGEVEIRYDGLDILKPCIVAVSLELYNRARSREFCRMKKNMYNMNEI